MMQRIGLIGRLTALAIIGPERRRLSGQVLTITSNWVRALAYSIPKHPLFKSLQLRSHSLPNTGSVFN